MPLIQQFFRRNNRGRFRGGGGVAGEGERFSGTVFDANFHFHGKFWVNLINLTDFIKYFYFNKSILPPANVRKIAGQVANSVDPDQTPRSVASVLGLHCLLRPVCPNTRNMIKSKPLRNPGFAPVKTGSKMEVLNC